MNIRNSVLSSVADLHLDNALKYWIHFPWAKLITKLFLFSILQVMAVY